MGGVPSRHDLLVVLWYDVPDGLDPNSHKTRCQWSLITFRASPRWQEAPSAITVRSTLSHIGGPLLSIPVSDPLRYWLSPSSTSRNLGLAYIPVNSPLGSRKRNRGCSTVPLDSTIRRVYPFEFLSAREEYPIFPAELFGFFAGVISSFVCTARCSSLYTSSRSSIWGGKSFFTTLLNTLVLSGTPLSVSIDAALRCAERASNTLELDLQVFTIAASIELGGLW